MATTATSAPLPPPPPPPSKPSIGYVVVCTKTGAIIRLPITG